MAANWKWVIVFADGKKLTVNKARGARDAAVKARLLNDKFVSVITEIQKHAANGNGLMYKRYRFRGQSDPTLFDYHVQQRVLQRTGQLATPAPTPAPQTAPPAYSEVGKLRADLISMTTAYERERDQRDLLMKNHEALERKYAEALARIKELEAELKKPRTFKRIF